MSFWVRLRMDLSTLAYLLVVPVLLWLLLQRRESKALQNIHKLYQRLVLIILVLIGLGNVAVYHFWGTLLNYRAISYLGSEGGFRIPLGRTNVLVSVGDCCRSLLGLVRSECFAHG